jgi:two-component system, OmpR family, alkaline phosphatase synthesis response regulator PhoP
MENKKKKILVVDDDVQFVDMVKTLLESVGYEVAFAYQARKGIEMAKKSPPDLILFDVMFAGPPGPDGFESSRELHDDPKLKNVPVIIVSGFRKVLDIPFKYQPDEEWMPVQGFIEKPVKPDELLGVIRKVFGEGPAKKK